MIINLETKNDWPLQKENDRTWLNKAWPNMTEMTGHRRESRRTSKLHLLTTAKEYRSTACATVALTSACQSDHLRGGYATPVFTHALGAALGQCSQISQNMRWKWWKTEQKWGKNDVNVSRSEQNASESEVKCDENVRQNVISIALHGGSEGCLKAAEEQFASSHGMKDSSTTLETHTLSLSRSTDQS
jgi:hypothetical protein